MSIHRIHHGAALLRDGGAPRPSAGDLRTAVLWVLAVVPQAFGFWLVAGDIAGVPPGDTPTLLAASLLTIGLATLAQTVAGYRITIYEGPSAAYLAAIVVVAAGHNGDDLTAIAGGLIAAGAAVVLLAVLGFDRLIRRFFTPLIGMIFVLVITVAVLPTTLGRAVAVSDAHPLGTASGWAIGLTVLITGIALQQPRALRAYALLGALLAGAAMAAVLGVATAPDLAGGLAAPELLPWGAPQFTAAAILPFVIGAGLAAFNTVAAVEVSADVLELDETPGAGRRGLVVHGVTQAAGALLGNVLGSVARLDSMPIVQLLGNRRRRALATAAVLMMLLALVRPFLGLVAALPLNVSAALLALMLGAMVLQTLRRLWPLGTRARLIAFVALVPSIIWTPLHSSLSASAQLVGNPMLWGVVLGVALERATAPRSAGRGAEEPARSRV